MKARRCAAKSKQSGKRCRRAPALGQAVCRMHGAASPQAKRTALERLLVLADPAVARLAALMRHGRPDGVQLAAARDILDRAGLGAKSKLELSGRVQLGGLRVRLDAMGPQRAARLTELLQRADLDVEEQAELLVLRREAGLPEA